jgi:type II secretory pathway pseudopilin PulG
MSEASVVTLIVAIIGAAGTVAASVSSVLVHRTRKEQQAFQDENSEQHGRSMEAIREIGLVTRETQQDVRELRADFRDHLEEGHSPKKKATVPKAAAVKK